MHFTKPCSLVRIEYEEAAEAYLRSLPPEHFMEATAQATQREITLESLAILKTRRPNIQVFNELLVQYPLGRQQKIRQVVPDNMVVVHAEPIKANGSYDIPLQPVKPFWVLGYVSKHNKRKDYEVSHRKYERDLKIPYYLVFYPDGQELTLYRHNGRRYLSVRPNERDRYPLPELELEVAIVEGWIRFWHKGQLLPLPAELQRDLDQTRRQLAAEKRRADSASARADAEHAARLAGERELAELRGQLERAKRRKNNGSPPQG